MGITKLTTNGVTGTKYDIASADNYFMEPIATTLLGTATGTVTFSNIPQNYKHLQIRGLMAGGNTADIRFNGDTGSNYTAHNLFGNGSAAVSDQGGVANPKTAAVINFVQTSSSTNFAVSITDILDYANTSKNKTLKSLWGFDLNGSGYVGLYGGSWMNGSAINSITIISSSGNFTVNSRFSLYGIKG
jgi:hypothetical protein